MLPEETLYEKFIPNKDTALFKTWHSSSWEDKLRMLDKFQEKRCSWFGQKIIYQEAPQILPPDLYKNIKSEIARRILSKNKEKWQTIGMAYNEIDTLRNQADNRDDEVELKKLDEINEFIMSIEKKYERLVDFKKQINRKIKCLQILKMKILITKLKMKIFQ